MGKVTELISIFIEDDGEDTFSINVGCTEALCGLLGREAAHELCRSIGDQISEEVNQAAELMLEESEIIC